MRVSIIIPVFNGSSFIKESLGSLEKFLNQKFNSFEIIFKFDLGFKADDDDDD